MERTKVKAVIFDFDGVIHDTFEDLHKIHNATLENITREDMKRNVFGGNPQKYFERFSHEQQRLFTCSWADHCQKLTLQPEVRTILEELADEHTLFIVSSNTEENLLAYFKNNAFAHIFRKIYGAETHASKSEKFTLLFAEYAIDVSECVFVTDTLGDLIEANHVGIRTIAVDFGFHERDVLLQGNPYRIVSQFDQIAEVLREISL